MAGGKNMEYCDGVRDWFLCLKCEHICSQVCPLEGDDVVADLALRLKAAEIEREKLH
jgi:hypothetical protein